MAHALQQPLYPANQPAPHFLTQFYPTQPHAHSHINFSHLPHAYPERIKPERRRPKYTRSKNGCLTCRKKKVKCDEIKPKCTRCANSAVDCSWPPVTVKKKSNQRRKASPSEADVSNDRLSFSSTPSNDQETTTETISYLEGHDIDVRQNATTMQLSEQNVMRASAADADRRHSTPQLQVPTSFPLRRHSLQDFTIAQSEQQHGLGGAADECGALRLTQVPQVNNISRQPAEFLYPQSAAAHMYQFPAANGVQGLSNGSPYGSSRPSTASSLSLSQSLARRASSSRPSTAGSMPSSQYMQRPPSSAPESVSGEMYPTGLGPTYYPMNGGPHQRHSFDMSNTSTPGSVTSFSSSSRPSTAGSVASSPYMRNVMQGTDVMSSDRWMPANPSPLMQSVALAPPMGHAHAEAAYAPTSMHSTPQNSRPHTPWN